MGKLVANVDDDVKARAAALYDSMGMSLSTAVNMFLRQSLVDNGLPFKPTRHTPDGYPVPPVHNAYVRAPERRSCPTRGRAPRCRHPG